MKAEIGTDSSAGAPANEIEITPEMIEAGAKYLADFMDQGWSMADFLAQGCFEAMCKASRQCSLHIHLDDHKALQTLSQS